MATWLGILVLFAAFVALWLMLRLWAELTEIRRHLSRIEHWNSECAPVYLKSMRPSDDIIPPPPLVDIR